MQCPVEIYQLLNKPLTTHCWNSDKTKIAVATATGEIVYIFKRTDPSSNQWAKEAELKAHEQLITGLDWCRQTGRLLSCSMDRNVYVWTCQSNNWKPTLVALNFSKAVSCVSWSPAGDKFAAGTADGSIAVAYYDAENDWWIGKLAKQPLKHTVTSLCWHPDNRKLLAGCVDGQVQVVSGYIKSVDGEESSEIESFSFKSDCPVLDVSFSPNGSKMAWTSHDATCSIALSTSAESVFTVKVADWPMTQIKFLSENLIICAGHAYDPVLLGFKEGNWVKIDTIVAQEKAKSSSSSSGFGSAMAKFKSLDNCGTEKVASASRGKTGHYNTVNKISIIQNGKQVATSSLDGNLIIWNVNEVIANAGLSQLSL